MSGSNGTWIEGNWYSLLSANDPEAYTEDEIEELKKQPEIEKAWRNGKRRLTITDEDCVLSVIQPFPISTYHRTAVGNRSKYRIIAERTPENRMEKYDWEKYMDSLWDETQTFEAYLRLRDNPVAETSWYQ
jgi:hypothetical protein